MYDKKLILEALSKGAVTIGRGIKEVNGKPTGDEAIIFGVPKKKPIIHASMVFSRSYAGIPSDVKEVGVIRALQNTDRIRPPRPGYSIGHMAITAGTFGAVVKTEYGTPVILSNNHVLANCNECNMGDKIVQPGVYDGGGASDVIGSLHNWVPIHFMGEDSNCKFSKATAKTLNAMWAKSGRKTRFNAVVPMADANLVDAAICMPSIEISDDIIDIGTIMGTIEPVLGTPVKKSGRTTGFTRGYVSQVDVLTTVSYGSGRMAIFEDQIMIESDETFSMGGDSGSAILSNENMLCALLFAGSDTVTIANRIENVFSALKLSL